MPKATAKASEKATDNSDKLSRLISGVVMIFLDMTHIAYLTHLEAFSSLL